jgi:PAS domain-containing protein
MHSPDDVQYAMETTRVLREPDRRIDTFGDTRFEFLLLSELMDRAGQVRVRRGGVEAVKPRIVKPDGYSDVELEGFGDKARERFERMIEKLRASGQDLAFLNYGFRFRTGEVREELLHETLDDVRERLLEEARLEGNPAQAIIEGVDDAWEVSVIKFTLEMIGHSLPINRFDLQRRGLL